jgi:hypothetical protein
MEQQQKPNVQFYLPLNFKRCRFQIWARSAGENNRARIAVSAGVKKWAIFDLGKPGATSTAMTSCSKLATPTEWLQGQFAIIGWEREIGGVARRAHSSRWNGMKTALTMRFIYSFIYYSYVQ